MAYCYPVDKKVPYLDFPEISEMKSILLVTGIGYEDDKGVVG